MKKILVSVLSISLLVCALTGVSYGWRGKMAGMGDPYGLVQDESDFLTHPALIASGNGGTFYGDYRFTYTNVTDWDHTLDQFTAAGARTLNLTKETSGDEQEHEALVGAAFPLGPGRMGLFFQYARKRGAYDGTQVVWSLPATYYYDTYDLHSDLDNVAVRLLYGLPLRGLTLGGEVQLAYRQEKKESILNTDQGGGIRDLRTNYPWGGWYPYWNLFPFLIPYDSDYWEALLKGSLKGNIGLAAAEFTLRGGFIFAGNNEYAFESQEPIGTGLYRFNLDGGVDGRQIGGDLWVRYPLDGGLSLPFLLRVDYREKTRDGNGPGQLILTGRTYAYESRERSFEIEAGGGVDKKLDTGTRIAAGLYYQYLQGSTDICFWTNTGVSIDTDDYKDYPASTEHRVLARFTGERELSRAASLRMGLNLFYGWAEEDFVYNANKSGLAATDNISADGNRWGIGASVGGTVVFDGFTLEPFLNAGYRDLKLDGDGPATGGVYARSTLSKSRRDWYIGGGFSVLFDL